MVLISALVVILAAASGWLSDPVVRVTAGQHVRPTDLLDVGSDDAVGVTVRNVSRQLIRVCEWYLVSDNDGRRLRPPDVLPGSAPLPTVLAPGHEVSWFLGAHTLAAAAAATGCSRLRPEVVLDGPRRTARGGELPASRQA